MTDLINEIVISISNTIIPDLEKSRKNNKAAAQRVRVNSIKLEKLFKEFRKRSVIEITSTK